MKHQLDRAKISDWVKEGMTPDEIKTKLIYAAFNFVCVLINFSAKTTMQFFGWPLPVAGSLAFFFGGQMNFIFHNFITFKHHHPTHKGRWRRWKRFMVGNVSAWVINISMLLGLTMCGAGDILSFVGALITSGIFNWFYNKHFAFAEHPLDPPEDPPEERSTN